MEYFQHGLTDSVIKKFQSIIYDYYEKHGRNLPWRTTTTPYHILVSEMMLQQTQVERVIPKYYQFLEKFPNFESLASSSTEELLKVWRGLGYNRRALALKKIAEIVVEKYQGNLPSDVNKLRQLPGIGTYTASAVVAFAFDRPAVVIETNIRAVYIHFFFKDKDIVSDNELRPLVARTMDTRNPKKWYNALMDYGVLLKRILPNPTRKSKTYRKQSPFKGSNREMRGKVLKILLEKKTMRIDELSSELSVDLKRLIDIVTALEKEGFLSQNDGIIKLT